MNIDSLIKVGMRANDFFCRFIIQLIQTFIFLTRRNDGKTIP